VLKLLNVNKLKPNIIMPEGKGTYCSQVGRPSMKKKKKYIGRTSRTGKKLTSKSPKDLDIKGKPNKKKKFKAFLERATDPRGTKAHDKDPKGTTIGKTTKAGKKFIKKQATLPFARKKPDPKSANKLMKKLNKGK